jgi:hypothetical protein
LNKTKYIFLSWRRLRRAANDSFTKSSVKAFYETQMAEAALLASDLLARPARWDQHFRRATASTVLSVFYGYPTLKSEKDPIFKAINNFTERLVKAAFMGAHLVQFFPWMRHLPSRLVPSMRHSLNRLIEKSPKKLGEMEARRGGWVQARHCNVRRPFSYGRGKRCMNVPHASILHHYLYGCSA